jgi:hypothetical protein
MKMFYWLHLRRYAREKGGIEIPATGWDGERSEEKAQDTLSVYPGRQADYTELFLDFSPGNSRNSSVNLIVGYDEIH